MLAVNQENEQLMEDYEKLASDVGTPGFSWSGPGKVGMQPWALSLPDKELCLREALAVCTAPAPEPSVKTHSLWGEPSSDVFGWLA